MSNGQNGQIYFSMGNYSYKGIAPSVALYKGIFPDILSKLVAANLNVTPANTILMMMMIMMMMMMMVMMMMVMVMMMMF